MLTLLYTWEEIRRAIKLPLQINNKKNTDDLVLLHSSTSFKNVLNPDDYSSFGEIKKADEELVCF